MLIYSGQTERSGTYRVETPGSNPIHGYDLYFPYFLCHHNASPGKQYPKLTI